MVCFFLSFPAHFLFLVFLFLLQCPVSQLSLLTSTNRRLQTSSSPVTAAEPLAAVCSVSDPLPPFFVLAFPSSFLEFFSYRTLFLQPSSSRAVSSRLPPFPVAGKPPADPPPRPPHRRPTTLLWLQLSGSTTSQESTALCSLTELPVAPFSFRSSTSAVHFFAIPVDHTREHRPLASPSPGPSFHDQRALSSLLTPANQKLLSPPINPVSFQNLTLYRTGDQTHGGPPLLDPWRQTKGCSVPSFVLVSSVLCSLVNGFDFSAFLMTMLPFAPFVRLCSAPFTGWTMVLWFLCLIVVDFYFRVGVG